MRKVSQFWQHSLVWIFISSTHSLSDITAGGSPTAAIVKYLLFHILYALIFYTNYSFTVKLNLKWRYSIAVITMLLCPFACYLVYYILFVQVFDQKLPDFNATVYFYYLGNGIIYSISGIMFRRARDSRIAEKRAYQLEKEKAIAESKYLRARLNPHFLFNALNTLYALSIKGSKKLPEVILQLSTLLRYVLDNSEKKEVSLKNEINLIDNYIALQKHRLPNDFKLQYNKEVVNDQQKIMPMLFISLVENCFKHGDLSEEGEINISLKVDTDKVWFNTSNTIETHQEESSEIGLQNLEKRLAQYYNVYILETNEEEGKFETRLEITL